MGDAKTLEHSDDTECVRKTGSWRGVGLQGSKPKTRELLRGTKENNVNEFALQAIIFYLYLAPLILDCLYVPPLPGLNSSIWGTIIP